MASEITVMYAGQVIEQAPTTELLTNPVHEYTRGLLRKRCEGDRRVAPVFGPRRLPDEGRHARAFQA